MKELEIKNVNETRMLEEGETGLIGTPIAYEDIRPADMSGPILNVSDVIQIKPNSDKESTNDTMVVLAASKFVRDSVVTSVLNVGEEDSPISEEEMIDNLKNGTPMTDEEICKERETTINLNNKLIENSDKQLNFIKEMGIGDSDLIDSVKSSKEGLIETNAFLLSDKDVDTLVDTLKESVSDDVKHLRDIQDKPFPNNTIVKPELIEGEALVEINPITGEQTIIGTASQGQAKVDVTVSNIIDGEDKDILESTVINDETYSKLNEYGLSEEDTVIITKLMMRRMNNEKFSIYKELPQSVKNMVKSMCGSNNINHLQACSEIVLDNFISELKIEQEFVDFQDSLKKEMDIPNLLDMYGEHLKDSMEISLLQKADSLEEKEPEKAQTLREISAAFTDSYTFARQLKALCNNDKEARRLDKDLKKYDRICMEFNYKYKNSKFKINDIKLVAFSLDRLFKDEPVIPSIKKFVILFCRLCRNMDSNNVVEHTFMYYTIKNILSLDHLDIHSEMYTTIKNNIIEVINKIDRKGAEECEREGK